MSLDTSVLPDGIAVWEAATLVGEQQGADHEEVIQKMGPFLALHTHVFPPESITWTTPSIRTAGTFSNDVAPGPRSVNVLPAVREDYERRAERHHLTQYQLRFAQITNGDDLDDNLVFLCEAFGLNVRYLVP
jgi:hypothetical protein